MFWSHTALPCISDVDVATPLSAERDEPPPPTNGRRERQERLALPIVFCVLAALLRRRDFLED
eukprot:722618-Pyramimonas_sp.AAC.1